MLRVCVVDDDSLLLSGVRRVLKKASHTMELTVACGGEEALAALEKQPVDIVISDLSMPGIDGEMLLGQVQEQFPRVTRVLNTGALDAYRAFDMQLVAHRVIAKPMNATALMHMLHELGDLCSQCALLPECGRQAETQWHLAAAERLHEQQAPSITADVARQNPWLAMLLLQATHGGFVAAGDPQDVHSAVQALGPVRLGIMHRRLLELAQHNHDVTGDAGGSTAPPEPLPLVQLTREIAKHLAPVGAQRLDSAGEPAGEQHERQFIAIAESAAILRAASPAGTTNDAAERDRTLRIALDAARFSVPRAVVKAVRESVRSGGADEAAPGVALRWAASLLHEPDFMHCSETRRALPASVTLATLDRWRHHARKALAARRRAA